MPYKPAKLDDVVRFVGGGTPSKQESSFWNGSIPWVSPKDMKSFYISGSVDSITHTGLRDSACNLIPTGSVLTVVRSGVLIHTLPVALTTVPCALNQDMKAMIPSASLRSPFLAYWLLAKEHHILTTCVKKGATVQSIAMDNLRSQEIPLPPLPEQDRIVEILDQADTLRQQRRQADALSQRILPALFHEMFGDVRLNPHSWPIDTLQNLGRVVTGSTPSSKLDGMFDGSIPFVTPTDLKETWISHTRSVTEAGAAESRTVRSGSALVCCIGTVGKMGKATEQSAFNQQINAVEWFDDSYDSYGLEALRQIKDQMVLGASSTTLPIMNKSTFQVLQIPRPPKSLREKFAALVIELEGAVSNQTTSSATLEILFQTLLHRAFDGSLTAKWREGHAKELLQEMAHQAR